MTDHPQHCLVSTAWLAAHLDQPGLRIVDATYYLPAEDGDADADYEAEHTPGAVFFDIDDIKDPEDTLPHMLPSAEIFSHKVGRLGLGDDSRIIVYDPHGIFSA